MLSISSILSRFLWYCSTDLKLENILKTYLSSSADILLLDFSLSKIVGNDENCTEPNETLSFVVPEVLQGKPYDKISNIVSRSID